MWERIVKREKENRENIVVASALTTEPSYYAGWKHWFGSIRFLESSSLMTALPLGTQLVRMAIVSGFEIRVAVLHHSGTPGSPWVRRRNGIRYANRTNRWCQIARAAPISRRFCHGVSLFCLTIVGKSDVNHYAVIRIKRMMWAIFVYYSSLKICTFFCVTFSFTFLHFSTLNLLIKTNIIKKL